MKAKKYDTVIFDLDGTLLDTLEDLADSTNFVLSRFGYPARTLEEIRTFVGNGIGVLIEKALPFGRSNPQYEEILSLFKEHYRENSDNKTHVYDGVDKLLVSLKSAGIKLAVVSNKVDFAVKYLCSHYFGNIIDVAIGESDKVRRKPYPDEVYEALSLLGSEKSSAIYIGDSEVDIATGKNSGIEVLSVSWGFRTEDELICAGASKILSSAAAVSEYILGK